MNKNLNIPTLILYIFSAFLLWGISNKSTADFHRADYINYGANLSIQWNKNKYPPPESSLRTAILYYKLLAEHFPQNSCFNEMLGYSYIYAKDYKYATERMKKALELSPNRFWNRFNLGLAEYQQGHYEKAAQYFKNIVNMSQEAQYSAGLIAPLKQLPAEVRKNFFDQIFIFIQETQQKSWVMLIASYQHLGTKEKKDFINEISQKDPASGARFSVLLFDSKPAENFEGFAPLFHPWFDKIAPCKEFIFN